MNFLETLKKVHFQRQKIDQERKESLTSLNIVLHCLLSDRMLLDLLKKKEERGFPGIFIGKVLKSLV